MHIHRWCKMRITVRLEQHFFWGIVPSSPPGCWTWGLWAKKGKLVSDDLLTKKKVCFDSDHNLLLPRSDWYTCRSPYLLLMDKEKWRHNIGFVYLNPVFHFITKYMRKLYRICRPWFVFNNYSFLHCIILTGNIPVWFSLGLWDSNPASNSAVFFKDKVNFHLMFSTTFSISYRVRTVERSKAPDSRCISLHWIQWLRVFWSPYGGVGSNPTSAIYFCSVNF